MIIWDKQKDAWLRVHRNISFEDISAIINENAYIEIINSPMYQDQKFFIILLENYTHVVPFEEDAEGNIILKTVYPSRKYHKKYRGIS